MQVRQKVTCKVFQHLNCTSTYLKSSSTLTIIYECWIKKPGYYRAFRTALRWFICVGVEKCYYPSIVIRLVKNVSIRSNVSLTQHNLTKTLPATTKYRSKVQSNLRSLWLYQDSKEREKRSGLTISILLNTATLTNESEERGETRPDHTVTSVTEPVQPLVLSDVAPI